MFRRENREGRPERSDFRRSFGDREFKRTDRGERSFEDRQMHKVVCDSCGKDCMVPFKPTAGKPVFCNDCFKKSDSGDARRPSSFRRSDSSGSGRSEINQKALDEINAKLDRILEHLDLDSSD